MNSSDNFSKKEVRTLHPGTSPTSAWEPLALEEPLEILLYYRFLGRRARKPIAITMRTPGEDRDLALGFLLSESIISSREQIASMKTDPDEANRIEVHLKDNVQVDIPSLQRHFYTTSSCGVCGKASLEALRANHLGALPVAKNLISQETLFSLPEKLRAAQQLFGKTGGCHGTGLFDLQGEVLYLREDVGRHNGMDKVVGALFHEPEESRRRPEEILVLWSGRASFELVQKAVQARFPIAMAIGAPSSLAVELASEFGLTLLGFARKDRIHCYSHPERIRP